MENVVENPVENPRKTPAAPMPFEAFRPGQTFDGPSFVLQEEHIRRFAEISGDRNPIHLDPDFAGRTIHRGVIAHGLLLAAILSGMAYARGLLGANVLALEASEERYLRPARPGDLLLGELVIRETDPEAARRYGRVVWDTRLRKRLADGQELPVMSAVWTTLIFKQAWLRT